MTSRPQTDRGAPPTAKTAVGEPAAPANRVGVTHAEAGPEQGSGVPQQHATEAANTPISVLRFFSIGIGPSSSHTVGPMRAAKAFAERLRRDGLLDITARLEVRLCGSLGATGIGHGTDKAVIAGLAGEAPDTCDPDAVRDLCDQVQRAHRVVILGVREVAFDEDCLSFQHETVGAHSNGMCFVAFDERRRELLQQTYFSIGGGFVIDENGRQIDQASETGVSLPHPFDTGSQLVSLCERHNCAISDIVMANERCWSTENAVRQTLLKVWRAMADCVEAGLGHSGVLPGGLNVRRRAASMHERLRAHKSSLDGSQHNLWADWVSLWALAVNEENAAGERVVTAPTNGAAGIIPAVLHYYHRFCLPEANAEARDQSTVRFLLTAGAIGLLIKKNASISGAEVGCQGEIGSACAMAAAGLTELLGGGPRQVENAAEIGIEHHLGMTCDPVGGLVQIPCIERNAFGAVKAITASRLALHGDGSHRVSLDKAIDTLRETGRDMLTKYKETSLGGLAVTVVEC